MGERAGRVVHANKDPFEVYVGRGRGSKGTWGNPFRIWDPLGDPPPATGQEIRRGEHRRRARQRAREVVDR